MRIKKNEHTPFVSTSFLKITKVMLLKLTLHFQLCIAAVWWHMIVFVLDGCELMKLGPKIIQKQNYILKP